MGESGNRLYNRFQNVEGSVDERPQPPTGEGWPERDTLAHWGGLHKVSRDLPAEQGEEGPLYSKSWRC